LPLSRRGKPVSFGESCLRFNNYKKTLEIYQSHVSAILLLAASGMSGNKKQKIFPGLKLKIPINGHAFGVCGALHDCCLFPAAP
jgi:hypothetical protein